MLIYTDFDLLLMSVQDNRRQILVSKKAHECDTQCSKYCVGSLYHMKHEQGVSALLGLTGPLGYFSNAFGVVAVVVVAGRR